MGENAAETVEEIEALRARLDLEFREFGQRLPDPSTVAKRAATLVGVAGGLLAVGGVVATRAAGRRAVRFRSSAAWRAARPGDVAARVDLLLGERRWRPWLAGAAALWLVVNLVEITQLRRVRSAVALTDGSGVARPR